MEGATAPPPLGDDMPRSKNLIKQDQAEKFCPQNINDPVNQGYMRRKYLVYPTGADALGVDSDQPATESSIKPSDGTGLTTPASGPTFIKQTSSRKNALPRRSGAGSHPGGGFE